MSSHNDPHYPTPYVATVSKLMPTGKVTIEGASAATANQALENLRKVRQEYYESGGWGGPG